LDSNKLSCGKGEISIEYVSFPQAPGTGGNSPVSALNLVTIEVPDACRCVVIGWVSLQIKATSPIVLVPGMLTGPSFWTLDPITIDDHLRAERFVVVDTIDHQAESITDTASNLMKEVEKAALRNGVDSVHLVAHSKGGLDSIRMLAKEIKSSDPFDILSLTTLDSPLRGSVLADMVHARQQALIAALFVVINVMEHALVLDLIGKGLPRSSASTRSSDTVRERVRLSYRQRPSVRLPTTFHCLRCWRRFFRLRVRLRPIPSGGR